MKRLLITLILIFASLAAAAQQPTAPDSIEIVKASNVPNAPKDTFNASDWGM